MAKIFYRRLNDSQIAEINANGWNCPVGDAYQKARDGNFEAALTFGLYELAAELPDSMSEERIYAKLQNLTCAGWAGDEDVTRRTEFARSMDVGDVIIFDDGRTRYCASFGFEDCVFNPGDMK